MTDLPIRVDAAVTLPRGDINSFFDGSGFEVYTQNPAHINLQWTNPADIQAYNVSRAQQRCPLSSVPAYNYPGFGLWHLNVCPTCLANTQPALWEDRGRYPMTAISWIENLGRRGTHTLTLTMTGGTVLSIDALQIVPNTL